MLSETHQFTCFSSPDFLWLQLSGSWRDEHKDARVVVMILKQRDTSGGMFPYWPHFGKTHSDERSCVFHSLFSPSRAVTDQTAARKQQLLGPDASKPYVAIHLRLGGLEGEKDAVTRFDHFKVCISVCRDVDG